MSVKFIHLENKMDTGECIRELNLLAHAQLIELDIGSQCGGHGKCGKDKIRLNPEDQKKVNPPTAIEIHQLTPIEINEGVRLACQCFPNDSGETLKAYFNEFS